MTDELHTVTFTLEIEPSALALLQQQAEQQGLTLDQLVARSIGRAAAQAERPAGRIQAASAFNGWVERNRPKSCQEAPGHQYVRVRMVSLCIFALLGPVASV